MGRCEEKEEDRKRVLQISHINRSVERRRESIRWMRELFLQRARQKRLTDIAYRFPLF